MLEQNSKIFCKNITDSTYIIGKDYLRLTFYHFMGQAEIIFSPFVPYSRKNSLFEKYFILKLEERKKKIKRTLAKE
jgi:hypothetical protein